MFITDKPYYLSPVFWKYFKYGKHSIETSFTIEETMSAKPPELESGGSADRLGIIFQLLVTYFDQNF
jgi:hypothetical protein